MFYEAESDIWLVWGSFGQFLGCFGAEICFISFQYFKATTQWRPKSVYFKLYQTCTTVTVFRDGPSCFFLKVSKTFH